MPKAPVATDPDVVLGADNRLVIGRDLADEITKAEGILSPEEQLTICALIAQFKTTPYILNLLRRGGNKKATTATVLHYRRSGKWQPLIDRLRTEYQARILEVPIANARVRLDALQDQFEAAERLETKTPERAASTRGEIREILQQAREEVLDRKGGSITYVTQIMQLSDEELARRRMEVLQRIEKLGGPDGVPRIPTQRTTRAAVRDGDRRPDQGQHEVSIHRGPSGQPERPPRDYHQGEQVDGQPKPPSPAPA